MERKEDHSSIRSRKDSVSVYSDIKVDDNFLNESIESSVIVQKASIGLETKIMQAQIHRLTKERLEYQKKQEDFETIREEIEVLKDKLSQAMMQNSILFAKLKRREEENNNEDDTIMTNKIMSKLVKTEKELAKCKAENAELEKK
eukprot:TRINITY_DN4637_c0_g1_i3.p2 TRINITY_DN4637_c0_g1~~TRINITY_DN4637_c0_g1_i3.p2  ORF type:complete len:145 (+),score=30.00 TRINITY_DN4637_c0_g1_i3:149-583(+)